MSQPRRGYRRCTRCQKNRQEKFFSQKGRICSTCKKKARSKSAHAARVQSTYGLLPGEYDLLFQAQGGVCAICQQPRKQRLSVDHSHKTGQVRGLLCRLCNGRLLTSARDSSATLRRAAQYLEDPPASRYIGERIHIDLRKG